MIIAGTWAGVNMTYRREASSGRQAGARYIEDRPSTTTITGERVSVLLLTLGAVVGSALALFNYLFYRKILQTSVALDLIRFAFGFHILPDA
jgi:hypothetical protein